MNKWKSCKSKKAASILSSLFYWQSFLFIVLICSCRFNYFSFSTQLSDQIISINLEFFFNFACALPQKSLDPLSIHFNVVEAGNAGAAETGKVFGGQALTPFMYPCICWWNEYVCKAGKGMATEGLNDLFRTIG
jgi:hypothetical protein